MGAAWLFLLWFDMSSTWSVLQSTTGHVFAVISKLFHLLLPIIYSVYFLGIPANDVHTYRCRFDCWKIVLAIQEIIELAETCKFFSCFLFVSIIDLIMFSSLMFPISHPSLELQSYLPCFVCFRLNTSIKFLLFCISCWSIYINHTKGTDIQVLWPRPK